MLFGTIEVKKFLLYFKIMDSVTKDNTQLLLPCLIMLTVATQSMVYKVAEKTQTITE